MTVAAPVIAADLAVIAADLPDRAGTRNLYQRGVGIDSKPRCRNASAEVTHRAVVDQISRPVRAELDRGRAVDASQHVGERLVGVHFTSRAAVRIVILAALRAIERKARHLQLVRIALAREVDELYVVAEDWVAVFGRKAEISVRLTADCIA